MVNTVESTRHIQEAEQTNAIVPEITELSTNSDTSLLPYAADDSTSHCTLRSDTIVQSTGLKTQEGTEVDDSTSEMSIKEEEVDLGCDYYEPEGNVYSNQRLQSVITSSSLTKLKFVRAPSPALAPPAVPEATVVTEEALSSSDVLGAKITPICLDAAPGRSEGDKDDDICVVEIVKANKTSVAQYWERYESHFRCKRCLKVFLRKGKCESHIRTHLGVKPYECRICKLRFRRKRMLNEHGFVHSGKKLYVCVFCSKAFRFRNNFQRHTKNHSEPQLTNHVCNHCGKGFNSQWKYWQHKSSKHLLLNADIVIN